MQRWAKPEPCPEQWVPLQLVALKRFHDAAPWGAAASSSASPGRYSWCDVASGFSEREGETGLLFPTTCPRHVEGSGPGSRYLTPPPSALTKHSAISVVCSVCLVLLWQVLSVSPLRNFSVASKY